jgi:hypothetical protein
MMSISGNCERLFVTLDHWSRLMYLSKYFPGMYVKYWPSLLLHAYEELISRAFATMWSGIDFYYRDFVLLRFVLSEYRIISKIFIDILSHLDIFYRYCVSYRYFFHRDFVLSAAAWTGNHRSRESNKPVIFAACL